MILRQLHLRDAIDDAFPSSQLDSEANHPEVRQLGEDYPSLPQEYLSFLLTVGCGTVGKAQFQIYGSVQEPPEVLDQKYPNIPPSTLFVGDDFSGTYVGYVDGCFCTFRESNAEFSRLPDTTITEFMEQWLTAQESGNIQQPPGRVR